MQSVALSYDDCYRGFGDFYDRLAQLCGINPERVESYDPKYLKVTADVEDTLMSFMKDQNLDRASARMAYLNWGPSMETIQGTMRAHVLKGFFKMSTTKVVSRSIKPRSLETKKSSVCKKPGIIKKGTFSRDRKSEYVRKDGIIGTYLGIIPDKKK